LNVQYGNELLMLPMCGMHRRRRLSPFSADTTSQLDVLWHDSHTLRMDSTQVSILEQADEICLTRLLYDAHTHKMWFNSHFKSSLH